MHEEKNQMTKHLANKAPENCQRSS